MGRLSLTVILLLIALAMGLGSYPRHLSKPHKIKEYRSPILSRTIYHPILDPCILIHIRCISSR